MAIEVSRPRREIGAPLYIGIAIVILAGVVFGYLQYLSRQDRQNLALTGEAKAYIGNLRVSDVEMKASESYFKQVVVEINGKIGNAGTRNLDSVEIYCVFYDRYGQLVLRQRVPIVTTRAGGLKPGETKSFRLPFDEIPESWNQAMPQLVIAGIHFS